MGEDEGEEFGSVGYVIVRFVMGLLAAARAELGVAEGHKLEGMDQLF